VYSLPVASQSQLSLFVPTNSDTSVDFVESRTTAMFSYAKVHLYSTEKCQILVVESIILIFICLSSSNDRADLIWSSKIAKGRCRAFLFVGKFLVSGKR